MSTEEKEFKANIIKKMDEERVKNWGKFDKNKI